MTKITRLLLCSCEESMGIDPASAAAALGDVDVKTAHRLCTDDLDVAADCGQPLDDRFTP
jgi:hypothetical protein